MKLPPLPDPVIVDGRRLYTAGQMREYAYQCIDLVSTDDEPCDWIPPEMKWKGPQPKYDVDFLSKIIGMK